MITYSKGREVIMNESEIKRALDGIGVFIDDVKDILDKQRNITTDVLRAYSLHGNGAVEALRCLIDYTVDNGEVDLTEEFKELHKTASDLTFGKYGSLPEDDEDEERNSLFAHVAFRIADIWTEIQRTWKWMEAHESEGKDEASTRPKAEAKKLYYLFVSGCTGKACELADAINDAIDAYTPRKGQGYNKEIARAAAAFRDSCLGQRCLKNGFADWAPFLRAVYEAMNLNPSRYSKCDVK